MFFIGLISSLIPFFLLMLANGKSNVKKENRNRQYAMPFFAVVYSIVLMIFLDRIAVYLTDLFLKLADLAAKFNLPEVGKMIRELYAGRGIYLMLVLFNTAAFTVFVVLKRSMTLVSGRIEVERESLVGAFCELFYAYDEEDRKWYIRRHCGQACAYLKVIYYSTCVMTTAALLVSCSFCMNKLVAAPFYPVFVVIIIGELAFFVDGQEKDSQKSSLSLEADKSKHIVMYPHLRKPLRILFGDKLSDDGTTVNNGGITGGAIEDILIGMEKEGNHIGKNYAAFIRKKMDGGFKPNVDYVRCGYDLACGKSLLFNTPFYDKLNPYVFYAITRELLTGGKVLIVLGRHGTEEDILKWSSAGMKEISNIPDLWKISVLDGKKKSEEEWPDIGVISRSGVHDLDIHKNYLAFLRKVSFVVVVEPSRLVTTAQIGLNLLIKCCGKDRPMTFCSVDRNCDGLVDALSHILMTNITEVSATEYPNGMSSYMYWTADGEYLQHRIQRLLILASSYGEQHYYRLHQLLQL